MNLTGRWKGKYTYGEGYPASVVGTSEWFEIELTDNEGLISGSCIDELVSSIEGKESTIDGTYSNNFISFVKKYKYYTFIDDLDRQVLREDIKVDGIHYTGRLFKKFFTGKKYFKGEWVHSATLIDDNNDKHPLVSNGTWEMQEVNKMRSTSVTMKR
jgi:hypothetical protein